mgnify:CR=1 FL=1
MGINVYWIVHNEEIHNYVELREELETDYEAKFTANTDTEVVLRSYIMRVNECVKRFNGQWAFAIYNPNKKIIFCSRDGFGIKPFYYYLDDDKFIFASEIKAILSLMFQQPC